MTAEPVQSAVEARHGCPVGADHDREIPEIDLLSPLTLRGVTLRNRIVMSPMCQYIAHEGLADDWHLDGIVAAFEAAARRALAAGFRVIEIHAAHGYLLHEFLSPLSNHREDRYGGSLENRMRLLLRVAERLRRLLPEELPLFVRISATDWVEGGWDIEQSVNLAKHLKDLCVDLIDVSSGALVPKARIPVGKGYQVPLSRRIRDETGIKTGAVGLITDPCFADEIVTGGDADLVFIAREMLREPYWALKAQHVLGEEPSWPTPYGYAVKRRAK